MEKIPGTQKYLVEIVAMFATFLPTVLWYAGLEECATAVHCRLRLWAWCTCTKAKFLPLHEHTLHILQRSKKAKKKRKEKVLHVWNTCYT